MAEAAVAALPFTIGSRISKRQSFTIPSTPLAAAAPTTPAGTPVAIPAVGWIQTLRLEFTLTNTGGAPTFKPDAPFNLIQNITFKNAAGQNLVSPLTGYEWYIQNKYLGLGAGITSAAGRVADPKIGRQYSAVATTGTHFFLDIPIGLDQSSALGTIPALAGNRNYQLEISFAALSTIFGGTVPTSASISVDATAIYWDVPSAGTPGGVAQADEPFGAGTLGLIMKDNPLVAPGEQMTRLSNVGNVLRCITFIARDATGARVDADWPSIAELFVDNAPMLRYKKTEWQDDMVRQYQYDAAALDAPGGLDTGVYVIPFHLFAGGTNGDVNNPRSQYMATLDSTQLQLKGYGWGSNISQLAIITHSITSPNAQYIYSK